MHDCKKKKLKKARKKVGPMAPHNNINNVAFSTLCVLRALLYKHIIFVILDGGRVQNVLHTKLTKAQNARKRNDKTLTKS